jgi:hypothetical protein|tara:strand:+ start:12798 stop:12992 length:195 start_codon:yes stop_codon:yes gene_type:complete
MLGDGYHGVLLNRLVGAIMPISPRNTKRASASRGGFVAVSVISQFFRIYFVEDIFRSYLSSLQI